MTDVALLMAILAVASKHLSAIASLDASVSDSYYQRSIEALTPTLRLPGISNNDNIMATTVLLRFWEEFGGKLCPVVYLLNICAHESFSFHRTTYRSRH